jgi:predicted SAM-dependent methyltransferase
VGRKFNLGAGNLPKEGYEGVDINVKGHLPWDIRNLPIEDDSADAFWVQHVLEHFPEQEVQPLLLHWYTKLAWDGTIYIEVPDFEWVVKDWLNADEDNRWGWNLQRIFGLQCHEGEFHKTGFTVPRLAKHVMQAGFYIKRCESVFNTMHNSYVIELEGYK